MLAKFILPHMVLTVNNMGAVVCKYEKTEIQMNNKDSKIIGTMRIHVMIASQSAMEIKRTTRSKINALMFQVNTYVSMIKDSREPHNCQHAEPLDHWMATFRCLDVGAL